MYPRIATVYRNKNNQPAVFLAGDGPPITFECYSDADATLIAKAWDPSYGQKDVAHPAKPQMETAASKPSPDIASDFSDITAEQLNNAILGMDAGDRPSFLKLLSVANTEVPLTLPKDEVYHLIQLVVRAINKQ